MESRQRDAMPPLVRISQVEENFATDSALAVVARWVREYLMRPHPQLGRRGAVCPFVPISIELDTMWMAEVTDPRPSIESLTEAIVGYRDAFLRAEPHEGSLALQKAFLIVFPALGEGGPAAAAFVDSVQYNLKHSFVEMGLMIGEFHSYNDSPGLRNPDFKPLRSPVPMLAIRHMVESDLPFLARRSYPAKDRASFLRSYLSCLGTSLSPAKFDQAFEALIGAKAELWIAGIRAGEVAPVTRSFVLDTSLDMILSSVAP
jgi:hypothetical protein